MRDPEGRAVRFRRNWVQKKLYDDLWYFNVILKARQLGFSTFILIYILDSCLFNQNHAAGVIAHTLPDAEDLFENKVKFAYDALPDAIKSRIRASRDSARKLSFSNGSSITIGTSLRGGTFQKLHVSEYGKIAARDPGKAVEIKTGALNTVHVGQQIFIESTAEGRQGEFYELCERARRIADEGRLLSPMDPRFHFFPWFENPAFAMDSWAATTSVPLETEEYFKTLPVSLTPGQKAWYVRKAETMGDYMRREYPSTAEEAFAQAIEGAYYGRQMAMIRKAGQITKVPWEPSLPVHTFWDIGGHDAMTVWFFQHVGREYRFLRYWESWGSDLPEAANALRGFGYTYGDHYWPHDGAHKSLSTGRPLREAAQELGIRPITIVPRTSDVNTDIRARVQPVLPRCWFDEAGCKLGLAHLDAYRKEWDDTLGVWKDKPRHDAASHGADAFRTFAVGYQGRREEFYRNDAPAFAVVDHNPF